MKKIIIVLFLALMLVSCNEKESASLKPQYEHLSSGVTDIFYAYESLLGTNVLYEGSDGLEIKAGLYEYDHYLNTYVFKSDTFSAMPYLYNGDIIQLAFGLRTSYYQDELCYSPSLAFKANHQDTDNGAFDMLVNFDLLDEHDPNNSLLRYDLYTIEELDDHNKAFLRLVLSDDFEYLINLDASADAKIKEGALAYRLDLSLAQETTNSLRYYFQDFDQTYQIGLIDGASFGYQIASDTELEESVIELFELKDDGNFEKTDEIRFAELPSFLNTFDYEAKLKYEKEELIVDFSFNDEHREFKLAGNYSKNDDIRLVTSGTSFGVQSGNKLPLALIYVGDDAKKAQLEFSNELPSKDSLKDAKCAYAFFIRSY